VGRKSAEGTSGFWGALTDSGWRRDERMLRYIKMAKAACSPAHVARQRPR
jgi:hypothetical protein